MPLLNVGDKAPDFTATAHDGRTVRLSDYQGKNVVLWFYPKADTPGWTVQGNVLRDRAKDIEAKNAAILGASFDTVADNKKFAEKFKFTYPLLSDTTRELGVKYGAADEATQRTAVRVAYLIGPDGRIKHVWPKATPKTFADEVLEHL